MCVCVSVSRCQVSVCALGASSFCLITLQTERDQKQQLQCAEQEPERDGERERDGECIADIFRLDSLRAHACKKILPHNWLNSRGAKLIAYFQAAIKN